jgi:CHAT domain-containing protein/tetratricopeptide (TPR) repeat protein
MRSCAKLWAFCLLPVLLFGEAPTRALTADPSQSQASAQQPASTPAPVDEWKSRTSQAVAPEEPAELRTFVEQYYAAYARKDLDTLMALWSPQSPDLESHRKTVQQFFVTDDKITATAITMEEAKPDGEKARLRISLDMSATRVLIGDNDPTLGHVIRVLECVKQTGGWKVWRETNPVGELASSLIAAASDEERNTLLDGNKDLVTRNLAATLTAQGESSFKAGDFPKALNILTLAMPIAERVNDQASVSIIWRRMGNVSYSRGDYKQALDDEQKSLAVAEKIGNPRLIAPALTEIGTVQRLSYKYSAALENYKKSLELSESLQDGRMMVINLSNIGDCFLEQDQYAQGQEYYERALTAARKARNDQYVPGILDGLGNIAYYQSNYALALKYYQEALTRVQKETDPVLEGALLGSMGSVALEMGDLPEALSYERKSLAIRERLGAKGSIIFALIAMADVEAMQKNHAAALKNYQRALKLAEELGDKLRMSEVLYAMGETYSRRGDYASALDSHLKSLNLADDLNVPRQVAQSSASVSGDYFHLARFDKTLEFAERAVAIAKTIGDRERLFEAHTNAGRAYRALHQSDRASAAFEEAIDAVESLRADVAGGEQEQHQFFAEKVTPYQQMAEMLVEQNHVTEALAFVERAKGKALLDVLRGGRIRITKAMTATERDREEQLEAELVSLNNEVQQETQQAKPDQEHLNDLKRRLEQARVEFDQFQTTLYANHSELRVQRGQVAPVTLVDAAHLLPENGAVLEFLVGEKALHLFVITRNPDQAEPELRVYPIGIGAEDLTGRAEAFRQQLALHDLNFRASARGLYKLLLKPAQQQLAGKNALIIVPDGPLWNLPFQALRQNNRYLVENYAIAYAPSLTVLREMMHLRQKNLPPETSSQANTLLAMADPALGTESLARAAIVYRGEKLSSLPETRQEVHALRQLYGALQSEIYTGGDAREDRFKAEAGKFRILHLATHGILDNASPMYSNILLSPGDNGQEDGLLEAREIMQMDLKADLAVLSACETARGRISAGEGVIGLSWAFFVAGTSTTVVSQWKVESISTAKLMMAFHRARQADDQGASTFRTARALQQAELQLLHDPRFKDPVYWAGFVVVGDPE